jgi:hypothetical protein
MTLSGSPSIDRPLFAFAGIWTEFKGDRGGTKSKPMLAVTRSTVS